MDLAAMVTLLVMALALATQPYSVLAGIILVATAGGQGKLAAYVVGWAAALSAIMVATITIAPNTGSTSSGSAVPPSVEVLLGLAFAAILAVLWRRSRGTASEEPSWLRRLEAMPWILALALGAFLPNYLMVAAASTEMLQVGLTAGALAATGIAFVVIASLGVAAPLGVLVTRREQAPEVYDSWRTWILGHNKHIVYGMGGICCAMLIAKGMWGLLS